MEHCDLLNTCPEDELMAPGEDCMDASMDEALLETSPIQSPLQVFAGMGGLALIAERLPMLYPDVIQQVRLQSCRIHRHTAEPRKHHCKSLVQCKIKSHSSRHSF